MWTLTVPLMMAPFAPRPSKTRTPQVTQTRPRSCSLVMFLQKRTILGFSLCIFHTGSIPESPNFFSASPFKVLSPQPPKFLKSLLPVKEENKAKRVLEARPLLGQEVKRAELSQAGSIGLFCPVVPCAAKLWHSSDPRAHFYHLIWARTINLPNLCWLQCTIWFYLY